MQEICGSEDGNCDDAQPAPGIDLDAANADAAAAVIAAASQALSARESHSDATPSGPTDVDLWGYDQARADAQDGYLTARTVVSVDLLDLYRVLFIDGPRESAKKAWKDSTRLDCMDAGCQACQRVDEGLAVLEEQCGDPSSLNRYFCMSFLRTSDCCAEASGDDLTDPAIPVDPGRVYPTPDGGMECAGTSIDLAREACEYACRFAMDEQCEAQCLRPVTRDYVLAPADGDLCHYLYSEACFDDGPILVAPGEPVPDPTPSGIVDAGAFFGATQGDLTLGRNAIASDLERAPR